MQDGIQFGTQRKAGKRAPEGQRSNNAGDVDPSATGAEDEASSDLFSANFTTPTFQSEMARP